MRKVVINAGYGGFSLSYKAMMRYAELKGIKLYAFVNPDFDFKRLVPYDGISEAFVIHYATEPLGEDGKTKRGTYFSNSEIARDDPILVQVVKELGKEANGECATLKIVRIPDDIKWVINEYDGFESIEEEHRSWS